MRRRAGEAGSVWRGWVRRYRRARLAVARADCGRRLPVGVALYLLTFVVASVAALARVALVCTARFLLVGVCLLTPDGGIFGLWGSLDFLDGVLPGPMVCGLLAGAGPLFWSLMAFWVPSREGLWLRVVGGRRPSEEEAAVLSDALAPLEALDPRAKRAWCYVFDYQWPEAYVRGRVLLVSTGMLRCEGLRGVLAHELSHVVSWDGVMTSAIDRLVVWGDVLGFEPELDRDPAGVCWFVLRCWVALAGGRWVIPATRMAWAAVWRAREREADAYAARLGQGQTLAEHLEAVELPRARPRRYRFLDPFEHEPTALRIGRLRRVSGGGS